ncbi:MAG: flagellar motor switch protein FliG [Blastocatellia bacterium]|nr:flagellar motor switch protein FliG [Blastocatellia bacterium]
MAMTGTATTITETIVDQIGRAPARRPIEQVSGARKAAILCMSLGDDVASAIFKCLDDDEIQQIARELASLPRVSSEMADDVLEEFHQLLLARTYVVTGGVDYAKRLLVKSFGAEAGKRVLDKVTRSLESTVGFEALQKVDPQQLSKLFQSEHPQTIALVLAHLDVSTAADTIQYLPESQRADIVLRMASLQTISQDVIRHVSMVLDQKLKSIGSYNPQAVGGIRSVAELCNRLDRDVSRKLLEEIEGVQPDLALEIRNRMLTFDDLLLLDDIGIRELLQRVDKKVLTLALKGTTPELQGRIYSNMSSRAVELMKEEQEFMGQVKLKDVAGAQREIIEVLRELDEQGVINIAGGEEDAYVS